MYKLENVYTTKLELEERAENINRRKEVAGISIAFGSLVPMAFGMVYGYEMTQQKGTELLGGTLIFGSFIGGMAGITYGVHCLKKG